MVNPKTKMKNGTLLFNPKNIVDYEGKIMCNKCEEHYTPDKFYSARKLDMLYTHGKFPVCKSCLIKQYESYVKYDDRKDFAILLCQLLNRKFDDEVFMECQKQERSFSKFMLAIGKRDYIIHDFVDSDMISSSMRVRLEAEVAKKVLKEHSESIENEIRQKISGEVEREVSKKVKKENDKIFGIELKRLNKEKDTYITQKESEYKKALKVVEKDKSNVQKMKEELDTKTKNIEEKESLLRNFEAELSENAQQYETDSNLLKLEKDNFDNAKNRLERDVAIFEKDRESLVERIEHFDKEKKAFDEKVLNFDFSKSSKEDVNDKNEMPTIEQTRPIEDMTEEEIAKQEEERRKNNRRYRINRLKNDMKLNDVIIARWDGYGISPDEMVVAEGLYNSAINEYGISKKTEMANLEEWCVLKIKFKQAINTETASTVKNYREMIIKIENSLNMNRKKDEGFKAGSFGEIIKLIEDKVPLSLNEIPKRLVDVDGIEELAARHIGYTKVTAGTEDKETFENRYYKEIMDATQ